MRLDPDRLPRISALSLHRYDSIYRGRRTYPIIFNEKRPYPCIKHSVTTEGWTGIGDVTIIPT
jgi:hypothetical protein